MPSSTNGVFSSHIIPWINTNISLQRWQRLLFISRCSCWYLSVLLCSLSLSEMVLCPWIGSNKMMHSDGDNLTCHYRRWRGLLINFLNCCCDVGSTAALVLVGNGMIHWWIDGRIIRWCAVVMTTCCTITTDAPKSKFLEMADLWSNSMIVIVIVKEIYQDIKEGHLFFNK